jgi:hypothetical protein
LVLPVAVFYFTRFLRGQVAARFLVIMSVSWIPVLCAGRSQPYWTIYIWLFLAPIIAAFGYSMTQFLLAELHPTSGDQKPRVITRRSAAATILLALIVVFIASEITVGAAIPIVDGGEREGLEKAMKYIRDNARPGDIIADSVNFELIYYVQYYGLNVTIIPFMVPIKPRSVVEEAKGIYARPWVVSEAFLRSKPHFIVISWLRFLYNVNGTTKNMILSSYRIVSIQKPSVGFALVDSPWTSDFAGRVSFVLLERNT